MPAGELGRVVVGGVAVQDVARRLVRQDDHVVVAVRSPWRTSRLRSVVNGKS